MTKLQLLNLLKDVPDNMQVCVWNGYVDDFMRIDDLVITELVKPRIDERFAKIIKRTQYVLPNKFATEEDKKLLYEDKRKKIAILNVKIKDTICHDRWGKMSY